MGGGRLGSCDFLVSLLLGKWADKNVLVKRVRNKAGSFIFFDRVTFSAVI